MINVQNSKLPLTIDNNKVEPSTVSSICITI